MTWLPADPAVAAHLAEALRHYAPRARAMGVAVPPELDVLGRSCADYARKRLKATSLDALSRWLAPSGVMRLLVTTEEAAEVLAISSRQVQRLIHEERLPAVKIGGATRIRSADLDAFVAGLAPARQEEPCH